MNARFSIAIGKLSRMYCNLIATIKRPFTIEICSPVLANDCRTNYLQNFRLFVRSRSNKASNRNIMVHLIYLSYHYPHRNAM